MNIKSLLGRLKYIEGETNYNVSTVHGYMFTHIHGQAKEWNLLLEKETYSYRNKKISHEQKKIRFHADKVYNPIVINLRP